MIYLFSTLAISCILVIFVCAKFDLHEDSVTPMVFANITLCCFSFSLYWYWQVDAVTGLYYLYCSILCYTWFVCIIFYDSESHRIPLWFKKTVIFFSCCYGYFLSMRFFSSPMRSHTEIVVGSFLGGISLLIIAELVLSGCENERLTSFKKKMIINKILSLDST